MIKNFASEDEYKAEVAREAGFIKVDEEKIVKEVLAKVVVPKPKDGEDGKDYVLTEKDKKDIAKEIKVPVVEKIVEKTEVIKEQPIVTEVVKEVAVSDTPKEIQKKVLTLKEEWIPIDMIKGDFNTKVTKPANNFYDKRIESLIDVDLTNVPKTNGKYVFPASPAESDPIWAIDKPSYSTKAVADTLYKPIGYAPDLSAYLTSATAATIYIPYTGATTNVNLGTKTISAFSFSGSGSGLTGTAGSLTVGTALYAGNNGGLYYPGGSALTGPGILYYPGGYGQLADDTGHLYGNGSNLTGIFLASGATTGATSQVQNFTNGVNAGSTSITIAGTLSPNVAGNYTYAGQYGSHNYYQKGTEYIWYRSAYTQWVISAALGDISMPIWYIVSIAFTPPTTGYSNYNGSTGSPTLSSPTPLVVAGNFIAGGVGTSTIGGNLITGGVTADSLSVSGNGLFGSGTSGGTATPAFVSFGSSFGSNTVGSYGNLKWKMYTDGNPVNDYGIGMSANLMEIRAGNNAALGFFVNNGVEVMRMLSNGNVGIGTSSPGSTFSVNSNTSQTLGGSAYYNLGAFQANAGNVYNILGSQATAADGMIISTPNTRFAVDVGTYTGTVMAFGSGSAGSGNNTWLNMGRTAATGGKILVDAFNSGVGDTDLLLNTQFAGGNVGIGYGLSAAAVSLHVYGGSSVPASITVPATQFRIQRPGNSGAKWPPTADFKLGTYAAGINAQTQLDIALAHGGTGTPEVTVMTLLSSGNVGIGTTVPDKKLEVNLGTADAFRLTYNDANGSAATYMDTTVSSVGLTTFTAAGSAPAFAFSSTVNLKNYTVGTLPAGTRGDIAYVTDALAPAFLVAIAGGGAIVTPVFYDGTNWVAH